MTPADQAKPPYLRIADDLRTQIEQGELAPGVQLPSIRSLSEMYGSGTMTIQRAIAVLRESGLVTTSQGYGNFVRTPAGDDRGAPMSVVDHIAAMESDVKRLSRRLAALKHQVRAEEDQAPQSGQ